MTKQRRWRKEFPYFKVQVFYSRFASWKDERKAFDTVEAAQSYIDRQFLSKKTRIIIVESENHRVVHHRSGAESAAEQLREP